MPSDPTVEVLPDPTYPAAQVRIAGRTFPAVVGRSGVIPAPVKTEGDGCTPAGIHPLRRIFYRADRMPAPVSSLPVQAIGPGDAWCDDPASPAYNTLIQAPQSVERLKRDDHLYDLIVVVGYNDDPAEPGKGSAIFVHVARNQDDPSASPTEGCLALRRDDLIELVSLLPADATIYVASG